MLAEQENDTQRHEEGTYALRNSAVYKTDRVARRSYKR